MHHKVRVSRLEDCSKASVFRRHVGRYAHFSFHLVKGLRHDAAGVFCLAATEAVDECDAEH